MNGVPARSRFHVQTSGVSLTRQEPLNNSDYFRQERELVESGRTKVIGENVYLSKDKLPSINVFRYPRGIAERQMQRLERLRQTRNNHGVSQALANLEKACHDGCNILPSAVECADAGCSEGEMNWQPGSRPRVCAPSCK